MEFEQLAWFYHDWIEGYLPWNQGKPMSFDEIIGNTLCMTLTG